MFKIDVVDRQRYNNFWKYFFIGRHYLTGEKRFPYMKLSLFFLLPLIFMWEAPYLKETIFIVVFLINLIFFMSSFLAYYSEWVLLHNESFLLFRGKKIYKTKISNIVSLKKLKLGTPVIQIVYSSSVNLFFTIYRDFLPEDFAEELRKHNVDVSEDIVCNN